MEPFQRWSLAYVVAYLTAGGLGFALAPRWTRELFLSNQEYDDAGFRLTGMLMLGLAYLVAAILRNRDGKYYPVSIVVRSAFVLFLIALYTDGQDPMFLVITGIVLAGLLPSIYLHYVRPRLG